ncbi:hypothetical protein ElP_64440 [Tautonia plasticadhaerens]|uniref:Uncharacterized protein n=2 Tax=Tautonia plasticadhaerens TaxID=2527974 RepID=A0A518HCB6_9BACT|nr:hypothetical protein ElP_64440 [Tautonia plasticadhaerens]
MWRFRFQIGQMMIAVGVLAADLGAVRAMIAGHGLELRIGGAVLLLAFNFGGLLAVRGRGRAREFWLGFLWGGGIAAGSYLAGRSSPGSPLGEFWYGYHVRAERLWWPLVEATFRASGSVLVELLYVSMLTLTWILPIVGAALAGGILLRSVRDAERRGPEPPVRPIAS